MHIKNYINKKFIGLEKKIFNKFKNSIKSDLSTKILINHLIYLNLKTEKLLFTKNLNPEKIILEEINYLYSLIDNIHNFKEFSRDKFKRQKFNLEKNHKTLFQKLWVNYTFDEYKKERLGRYIKRIEINKIQGLIKNKKIVDFGCGHGNFLMSMIKFKPKKCVGIDYGKNSIDYANKFRKKFYPDQNISFLIRSVYQSKLKKNYFDFAIQNGVFHHLDYENKAYVEVHRVLKSGGYLWVYTDGGGGIRDFVWDLSQKLLKNIDNNIIQNQIRSIGLTTNKEYHLGDGLSARYRHTDLKGIKAKFKKIGFKYIRQLNGGFKTDFDYPYSKDKYFRKKFGSGDLRLLFQKI
jgi:ubiquinone/menaquinone biosynthesis C-methylase UbiE